MSESIYKPTAQILNLDAETGEGALTVVVQGRPLAIRSENPLFKQAIEAFRAQEWDTLHDLMQPEAAVKKATAQYGKVTVENGAVFYDGEQVHNLIVDRILTFLEQDLDVAFLLKFLEKLMQTPSKRAVDELYRFLEHKGIPIDTDGNIVAYKSVQPRTFLDWHSGKFVNKVGVELSMPRNKVDDEKDRTCSYGFHAGTYEYAKGFHGGACMVLVTIDPADVVSIPSDCNGQKMRTCRYKVVKVLEGGRIDDALVDADTYGTDDDDDHYNSNDVNYSEFDDPDED